MRYRIVKYDGKFRVQEKVLWFGWIWCTNIGDGYMEYSTEEEAEKAVKTWIKHGKENGKVIRTIGE